jgi:hypothetical protein
MPDFIMPEPKGNDEGWRTKSLIERAKAFVQAVAAQAPWAEIEPYYAPDVSQEEFPNRLLPKGTIRIWRPCARRAQGPEGDQSADHRDVNAISSGQCVVLEAIWTGTLAVGLARSNPATNCAPASPKSSEFKDGLIWRQRNYDCFEAW